MPSLRPTLRRTASEHRAGAYIGLRFGRLTGPVRAAIASVHGASFHLRRLTSSNIPNARDEEVLVEFLDDTGLSRLGHTREVVGEITRRRSPVNVNLGLGVVCHLMVLLLI